MSKSRKFRIALDLDGVLSAFEEAICVYLGIKSISEISKGKLWATVDKMNREKPFFEHLPMLPDALELFSYVRDNYEEVFILSAHGSTPQDAPSQKLNWVRKHLCPVVEVVCVPKSPDKAAYACPRTILIDDREKSINPFVAAGGLGILHRNAKDTIRQLQVLENV
jgi:5'(3')-deoxyribonucleotidase